MRTDLECFEDIKVSFKIINYPKIIEKILYYLILTDQSDREEGLFLNLNIYEGIYIIINVQLLNANEITQH